MSIPQLFISSYFIEFFIFVLNTQNYIKDSKEKTNY
jgi:hypothetical protein